MVMAAARLVRLAGADENHRIVIRGGRTVNEPLRPAGRGTAYRANRLQLRHRLSDRHQRRHGAKRFAAKILVEPRGDDAAASISERLHHIDDVVGKNCTSSMATTSVAAEM